MTCYHAYRPNTQIILILTAYGRGPCRSAGGSLFRSCVSCFTVTEEHAGEEKIEAGEVKDVEEKVEKNWREADWSVDICWEAFQRVVAVTISRRLRQILHNHSIACHENDGFFCGAQLQQEEGRLFI